MSFRAIVHYHNGYTVIGRSGENWTVYTRWAMMASRDSEVKHVNLNCEGVSQQRYIKGKPQWAIDHLKLMPQCSHNNSHG